MQGAILEMDGLLIDSGRIWQQHGMLWKKNRFKGMEVKTGSGTALKMCRPASLFKGIVSVLSE